MHDGAISASTHGEPAEVGQQANPPVRKPTTPFCNDRQQHHAMLGCADKLKNAEPLGSAQNRPMHLVLDGVCAVRLCCPTELRAALGDALALPKERLFARADRIWRLAPDGAVGWRQHCGSRALNSFPVLCCCCCTQPLASAGHPISGK